MDPMTIREKRAIEILGAILDLMHDEDPPPDASLMIEEWVEKAIAALSGEPEEPESWMEKFIGGEDYHERCCPECNDEDPTPDTGPAETSRPRIVILVEGGCVQEIEGDTHMVDVRVVDLDEEEDEELDDAMGWVNGEE